jgi:protein-tyrosine-phosphatase/DNA-binding transcriptional ArsR family regulator
MPPALQAVAEPRRWALLAELAKSDRRVGELTAALDESQNLVSYHLRELRNAGLVSSRRSSYDGRDAYYRVNLARCAEVLSGAASALDPGLRLGVVPPDPRRGRGRRPKVLFLCTGNSARSQMAEALLVHRSARTIDARSAGSAPKQLHPHAVRAMAARGVDIANSRPKHLARFTTTKFDLVVTLCDKVREVCPEFPGAEAIHWSTPDPSADDAPLKAFVAVAEDLEIRIAQLIARLSAPQGGVHG